MGILNASTKLAYVNGVAHLSMYFYVHYRSSCFALATRAQIKEERYGVALERQKRLLTAAKAMQLPGNPLDQASIFLLYELCFFLLASLLLHEHASGLFKICCVCFRHHG